ncbi:MAG: VWA domain-containing protein, partial [Gammaproteobacteria bacterium]|nr:VWA domain-containing protein [Gammaproteobacteria bacterium]
IPDDWLRSELQKQLTDEEKQKVKSISDLQELIEEFKKRLEEQQKRHEGGNKWIGTGGTSPFGNSGFNPGGMRVGGSGGNRSASKVWERRDYKNLDEDEQITARNIQVALRRLRKFARTGAEDELDIDDTISSTAKNAGYLDIKMVPERHNAVKVLIFFDVGGSMDYHVRAAQELFNAVRTEFKHLEYYYFHNFIYESVWKDNRRRHEERLPIQEVINTYSRDYKLIFVGDAAMSPYEVMQPGGSVEHWNDEAGAIWMKRLLRHFEKTAWINPEPEEGWKYTQSTQLIRELLDNRMYPLTVKGLEKGMAGLSK